MLRRSGEVQDEENVEDANEDPRCCRRLLRAGIWGINVPVDGERAEDDHHCCEGADLDVVWREVGRQHPPSCEDDEKELDDECEPCRAHEIVAQVGRDGCLRDEGHEPQRGGYCE